VRRPFATLRTALGRLMCRLLHGHRCAMWPIHSAYLCRKCGRDFPVAWGN
jgi:hypothetical protein